MSYELGAEELAGGVVAGNADVDGGGAGLVGLVVIGVGGGGDRCPSAVGGQGYR
jgi:hypothetical protein